MHMRTTPAPRTESTVSRVNDQSGGPAFAVCMFRDLTELKRNERRMLHGMTHDSLTGLLTAPSLNPTCANVSRKPAASMGTFLQCSTVRGSRSIPGVNVSPIQILDDNFEQDLLATALRWGIEPREVNLEITESFVLDPGSRSSTTVERLRASGFKVAIDDFGTGYSSLRYLQQFTVDSIKIDRSFVAATGGNVGSEPILRTLMALAEAFGVRVVAEGIESRRQRDVLESLGCTHAQGYYYSRPLPADEIARMYPRVFGGSASTATA